MAKVDARNVILMKEDGSHSGRQSTPKSTRSLRSSHKNEEGNPSMENDLATYEDKDYDIHDGDHEMKKDASGKNQKKKGAKPKSHPDKHSERNVFFWCHQCKQKHVQVVCCTRTCSKKYCTRCVWRHYREKVEEVDQTSWVCYYCQGVCSCAFCRRRRAKETNTKFESHRGKKRRITVDASPDEPVPKKRKIKSPPAKVEPSSVDQAYRGMINEKPHYLIKMKTEDDAVPDNAQDDVEVASEENEMREELEAEIGDLPHAQKDVGATMMALRKLRNRSDSKASQDKHYRGSHKDRRVTLKDLIDAGILKDGDELSVRNASKPATLLADGQIQWGTSIYRSLSTFTKQVAAKLELEKKTTLHNGWRSVYCRGKVMQQYQKEYRQLLVSRKDDYDSDEQDESLRISTDSNEMFNGYSGLTSDENSDKSFEAYATPSPENSPSDISSLLPESQGFLQNRHPSRRHKMRISNSSWTEQLQAPDQIDEIEEQWWMGIDDDSDDQIDNSPMSDDFSSPILSCFPDEPERDLLVIGHVDQFLDIRDKDFFNVTSNDDIFTHRSHAHGLEENGSHHTHHVRGDELGDWGDLESF